MTRVYEAYQGALLNGGFKLKVKNPTQTFLLNRTADDFFSTWILARLNRLTGRDYGVCEPEG